MSSDAPYGRLLPEHGEPIPLESFTIEVTNTLVLAPELPAGVRPVDLQGAMSYTGTITMDDRSILDAFQGTYMTVQYRVDGNPWHRKATTRKQRARRAWHRALWTLRIRRPLDATVTVPDCLVVPPGPETDGGGAE